MRRQSGSHYCTNLSLCNWNILVFCLLNDLETHRSLQLVEQLCEEEECWESAGVNSDPKPLLPPQCGSLSSGWVRL